MNFSGTCILAFVPIDSTYWLAGIPLLSGYYTVHDNIDSTKARMGFAPHVTSTKVNIATAFTPSNSVEGLRWELTFIYDIYQTVKSYSGDSLYSIFQFFGTWVAYFYVPSYLKSSTS